MAISLPIVSKYDDKGSNAAEKALKGIAAAGAVAFAAAVAGAAAFTVEALKAAAEAEAVTRGLENAAKNAGVFGDSAQAIGKATKALDDHSRTLGEMSGIDDEIINQIKTGWLAVPNLAALGTDGINKLAEVTADIAAGTGKDVQTIGLAFQRIAGDTETAFSKLTRAGIVFTDEQKRTFDSILATSGEMAAQAYLVEELGIKYEGAAEAAANPFDRLKVIFDNLSETIGLALLPAFESVVPYIQEFVANLTEDPAFQQFLADMGTNFQNMLVHLPSVVTELGNFGRDVLPAISAFFPALNEALALLGEVFFGIENSDPASSTNDFANAMKNLAGAFSTVQGVLKGVRDAWDRLPSIFKMNLGESLNPMEWLRRLGAIKPLTTQNYAPAPGGRYPGTAKGGVTAMSGLQWVGEKGPELVSLPQGATVTPIPQHMRSDNLVGSMRGGGGQVVYNIQVSGGIGVDGAQLGEQIVTAIRKYERTSGAVFARA